MSSSIVSAVLRTRVRALVEPIAIGLGRLGLTPNHLTFIGFGIAVIGAVAAAQQAWLAAGLLVLFGAVFDLFDGALARATGRVTKLGAFYDSVFDRWGEGVVYLGIVWGCVATGFGAGAVFATAALVSAVMVSYTRAKSESLGFTSGTNMASVGFAPREVRVAILTIGLILTGLSADSFVIDLPPGVACLEICPTSGTILAASLGLIAILATITTIQRILHVRAQAREG